MFGEYPDVMRVADVAQALGIGKNSAYELIHSGSIGAKKVGKTFLVPKICLVDFMLSARNSPDVAIVDNVDCHKKGDNNDR